MNNQFLKDLLESQNATCLIPLLEMVGNLDGLVKDGVPGFLNKIPVAMKDYHSELSDIDHILESDSESLTDKQLINYAKRRGEVRRERRIKKTEGAFLNREGVEGLIVGFTELLKLASVAVDEKESKLYLAKILEPPEGSSRVRSLKSSTYVEGVVSETTPAKLELVQPNVINEPIVIKKSEEEEVKAVRTYVKDDILETDGNTVYIKELLSEYRDKITLDSSFDITKLMEGWGDKFNKSESNYKKGILNECYYEFFSNPDNSMERAVANFAVWNHLLPKKLIATNYFTK